MKCLVLVLGLLLASASASLRFDDEIRDFVEYLRTQMPCGSEEYNIPPLAPYKETFRSIDLRNVGLGLMVNVSDASLEGLDSFEFHELAYKTIISIVNFDVTFKQVRLFGQYKAKAFGKIFGLPFVPFGDGNVELILQDVNFKGSFRLSQGILKGITMKAFKTSTEIGRIESKTTGVMNSLFFSNFFNEWVQEMFAIILTEYQDNVSDFVRDLIKPKCDSILSKMKLPQILGLALGLGDTGINFEELPVCNVN